MIAKPFGELRMGELTASRGRTITETDVVHFCMLTGNWLELHANAEFAKATTFGQRVVQGSLVFSIANALVPFNPDVVEAFYGADKLRFLKPTFINDTLWAESEVIALEPRGPAHGTVTLALRAVNQRGEIVMTCEFALLIRKHAR